MTPLQLVTDDFFCLRATLHEVKSSSTFCNLQPLLHSVTPWRQLATQFFSTGASSFVNLSDRRPRRASFPRLCRNKSLHIAQIALQRCEHLISASATKTFFNVALQIAENIEQQWQRLYVSEDTGLQVDCVAQQGTWVWQVMITCNAECHVRNAACKWE